MAALGDASADELHIVRVLLPGSEQVSFKLDPSSDLSNGWDLTVKALQVPEGKGFEFDYYGGEFGHIAKTIYGESPPDDGSWFWALYVWGAFTGEWVRSPGSVDSVDLDNFPHIAWVAFRTAAVERPIEEELVMNRLGTTAEGNN